MTDTEHDHSNNNHTHDAHDDDHHEHSPDSVWGVITSTLHLPGHAHGERPRRDDSMFINELGIRTVKAALVVLGSTTVLQVAIYLLSGSIALLADTVHNLGDAINSVPLWIAFVLARRSANKRYTYGYGRAEDVAGLAIVVSIAASAAYILYESISKFFRPEPVENLLWVAVAALIGFAGNELVAVMQIRVGRRIGSEAMVTDGRHARADGLTSLAVLAAVGGAWLGFPLADPIVGTLIGLTILIITRDAVVATWHRLMDAVDPELIDQAQSVIMQHPEVKAVERCQMRWLGHRLYVEAVLALDASLTMADADGIVDGVSHDLYHAIPNLGETTIEIVPWRAAGYEARSESRTHRVRMSQPG